MTLSEKFIAKFDELRKEKYDNQSAGPMTAMSGVLDEIELVSRTFIFLLDQMDERLKVAEGAEQRAKAEIDRLAGKLNIALEALGHYRFVLSDGRDLGAIAREALDKIKD